MQPSTSPAHRRRTSVRRMRVGAILRVALVLASACFLSHASAAPDEGALSTLSARAFLCNSQNQEITPPSWSSSSSVDPLQVGATLRVCVVVANDEIDDATDGVTDGNDDIYILKLSDFSFVRDIVVASPDQLDPSNSTNSTTNIVRITQQVIQNGVEFNTETTYLRCKPGSKLCVFQVVSLNESFFALNGTIQGVGSVALQYGDGRDGARRELRLRGGPIDNVHHYGDAAAATAARHLQDFAGMASLSLELAVAGSVQDGGGLWPRQDVSDDANRTSSGPLREYWTESETYVRGLIIGMFAIVVALIFCFCAGWCFWKTCCGDFAFGGKRSPRGGSQPPPSDWQHGGGDYYCEETATRTGPLFSFGALPAAIDWPSEHACKTEQPKRKSYLHDLEGDISETHSLDDDEDWGIGGNHRENSMNQEHRVIPPPEQQPPSGRKSSIRASSPRKKIGISASTSRVAADGTIVSNASKHTMKSANAKNGKKASRVKESTAYIGPSVD